MAGIVYLQGNDLPAISHDANENTNPSIRSHNGEFHPQFQVVRAGSSLQITNKDPIAHNTHVFYRGDTVLNVGLPLRDKVVTKVLPGTGVFSVRCDLHPTMQAWIFAPPSKFYAVVNEPQVVKFNNIPPGQHILHFWRNDNSENYRLVDLAPGEIKLLNQR